MIKQMRKAREEILKLSNELEEGNGDNSGVSLTRFKALKTGLS